MNYDILIRDAQILDGTGGPGYFSDAGIAGGKIAAIGRRLQGTAETVIDGRGLVLCPGFIDAHSHQDMALEHNPACRNDIGQGITTFVGGMCGESPAPMARAHLEDCIRVGGQPLDEKALQARRSLKDYFAYLAARPLGANAAFLVGHGMLRACVMGYENRRPTPEELGQMQALLAESMDAGALGLSFGLIYPPGSYAETEELIALARTAAEKGGLFTVHMRSESARLVEATMEMLRVAEESGCRCVISHHKATGGVFNWNKTAATLSLMEQAAARGCDVFCDQYPYTASSTGLATNIPDALHALGVEALLELLSPEKRETLRPVICGKKTSRERFQYTMIGWSASHPEYAGRMLNEIAAARGEDPFDTQCDLLIADRLGTSAIFHTQSEEDLERVMRWPRAMVGTDGVSYSDAEPAHPRTFAAFPRVLGRYVREKGVISLPEAIRKMTSLPAAVYGLAGKGLVREGMDADLVLFDPETVGDNATYTDPLQSNSGLRYVLLNGQIVLRDNEPTGAPAGRLLLRQQK